MELFASPTSPYARLLRVIAIEKGIIDRITMRPTNPWESPEALLAVNPYCRVPVLITDEGVILTENQLIAQWLDRQFPDPPLMPRPLAAFAKLGQAQGLIDAAVDIASARRLRKLPDDDPIQSRRQASFGPALKAIDTALAGADPDSPDMGDLALAVALGYLDFRLPELDWRGRSPALARWYSAIAERPSLRRTGPDEPL